MPGITQEIFIAVCCFVCVCVCVCVSVEEVMTFVCGASFTSLGSSIRCCCCRIYRNNNYCDFTCLFWMLFVFPIEASSHADERVCMCVLRLEFELELEFEFEF